MDGSINGVEDISTYLMAPDRVGMGVFMAIEYFEQQFFPLHSRLKFTLAAVSCLVLPVIGLILAVLYGHREFTPDSAVKTAGLSFTASQVIHKLFENASEKSAARDAASVVATPTDSVIPVAQAVQVPPTIPPVGPSLPPVQTVSPVIPTISPPPVAQVRQGYTSYTTAAISGQQ